MEQVNPVEAVMQMASGFWVSRALWGACRLGVADAIDDEPQPVERLAQKVGAEPDSLRRLLNALSAFGVFARDGEDRFAHTPLSRVLRSDDPATQRSFVESIYGDEHYEAWGVFDQTLRTGRTAFDLKFGKPVFEYFGEHPQSAQLFSQAMTATTKIVEQSMFEAHSFRPFTLAVDVGGSLGSLLRGVLARHPDAEGILFDRPRLVEQAEAVWAGTPEASRMRAVGGDFFEAVPEGGDLYLLKFILHDWTDQQCVQILKNIRSAIRPDGRLAVMEIVLPDNPEPHLGWLMDLNMLAMTGGRERTVAEYAKLFDAAGFRRDRVTRAVPMSVVEAVPV